MGKVKKYRFMLITLAVLAAAVVIALAAVIANYSRNQSFTTVGTISDGSGGAIVAWQNDKGIYVRHLDSSGKLLWLQGGLPVSEGTGTIIGSMVLSQVGFSMVSDGDGGLFVTAPTGSKIFIQHISSGGSRLWGSVIRLDR